LGGRTSSPSRPADGWWPTCHRSANRDQKVHRSATAHRLGVDTSTRCCSHHTEELRDGGRCTVPDEPSRGGVEVSVGGEPVASGQDGVARDPSAGPARSWDAAPPAFPGERRSARRHRPQGSRPAPDHHRPRVRSLPDLAGLLPADRRRPRARRLGCGRTTTARVVSQPAGGPAGDDPTGGPRSGHGGAHGGGGRTRATLGAVRSAVPRLRRLPAQNRARHPSRRPDATLPGGASEVGGQ